MTNTKTNLQEAVKAAKSDAKKYFEEHEIPFQVEFLSAQRGINVTPTFACLYAHTATWAVTDEKNNVLLSGTIDTISSALTLSGNAKEIMSQSKTLCAVIAQAVAEKANRANVQKPNKKAALAAVDEIFRLLGLKLDGQKVGLNAKYLDYLLMTSARIAGKESYNVQVISPRAMTIAVLKLASNLVQGRDIKILLSKSCEYKPAEKKPAKKKS